MTSEKPSDLPWDSQRLLDTLLNQTASGVWLADASGKLHLISDSFREQVSRVPVNSREQWLRHLEPTNRREAELAFTRALAEGRATCAYRLTSSDRSFEEKLIRIDASDDPLILGIVTDITFTRHLAQDHAELDAAYRTLVENLPINIVRKDRKGQITFANERYCRSLNQTLDQLVGKTDFDLFPKDLAEKYVEDDQQVISSGEVIQLIEEHQTPDHKKIYVEVMKGPVVDRHGQLIGVQVVFWDVSQRRQVELALEHERFLLHTLMEYLPDSIYFKDNESRFIRISRALAQKFDLNDPEAAIGHTDLDFFSEAHARQAREDERQLLENNVPFIDIEEQETWPDGSVTWAATTKLPLFDRKDQLIGTFGISRDITKRKSAEQQVAQANEELQREVQERQKVEQRLARERDLLRTLMDHLPDPIFVKDENFRYVTTNRALLDLLGLDKLEDIVGKTDFDLEPLELAEQYTADDEKVFESGQALIDREETSLDVAGNELWLLTTKVPLRDREGAITGLVGIGRNITKRKLAEEELRAAKEAADAANRAKSDFLANMSHEIRTPMNAIIGITELLLKTHLDDTQREYLTMVQQSGESLLAIINDILDLSKIEAGKLQLESEAFDLRDCIGSAVKSLALRAHSKHLELAYEVDHEVPNELIGDPGRIRQIIVNLLGNAIKFTERGEVITSVHVEQEDADCVTIRISVRDTGIGIPHDKLEHVFAKFEQADTSTTRRYGGTGLGLAISSQLVRGMRGKMQVESQVGVGSTFSFTARLKKGQPRQHHENLRTRLPGSILVVDDNQTNRRILQDVLSSWHLNVELVSSAEAAMGRLQAADQQPIELVLSDLHMPEMDGFDLVRWIRNQPQLRELPVVLLTSGDRPDDSQVCRELKIAKRLMKPVKQSELYNALLTLDERPLPLTDPALALNPEVRSLDILLAEDNLVNQTIALGMLQQLGHRVTIAESGVQALAALTRHSFDVILMDVQMPDMDGLAATEAIRRQEEATGEHIPIIAMTAHALKEDRQRCLDAGMDAYLAKPIRLRELQECLSHFNVPFPSVIQPTDAPESTHTRIDWEKALREVGGDTELLSDVLDAFLSESPRLEKELRDAYAQRDAMTFRRAAHTIKGALLFLGEDHVRPQAEALELLGKQQTLDGAGPLIEQLACDLNQLCDSMRDYLAQQSP